MPLLKVAAGASRGHAITIIASCINVAIGTPAWPAIVVTFVETGVHMDTSRHYFGDAVDVRSKTFPSLAAKRAFVQAVLARLDDARYSGMLEGIGTANEHFHFQWRPSAKGRS